MTRVITFLIISICFISCHEANNDTEKIAVGPYIEDKNDTLCSNSTDIIQVDDITLLEACYIKYAQWISDTIGAAYGGDRLDSLFNFEIYKNELKYIESGDTIILRRLFLSNYKDHRIKSQIIRQVKDTIFVREKYVNADSKNINSRDKFEEFTYTFIKKRDFQPIFKYLE